MSLGLYVAVIVLAAGALIVGALTMAVRDWLADRPFEEWRRSQAAIGDACRREVRHG